MPDDPPTRNATPPSAAHHDQATIAPRPIARRTRCNLSHTAHRYWRSRAVVVSIPKSGRTWVHALTQGYFALANGRPFSVELKDRASGVIFTHDLWGDQLAEKWYHPLVGNHLVPALRARSLRKVLLHRDPRDVLVSLYFQAAKREKYFDGDLSDLVRDDRLGIRPMVAIMNRWMADWADDRDGARTLRLSYEDLRVDPLTHFERYIRFVYGAVDAAALQQAVEQTSFDKLRQMEASGTADKGALRPADASDPESFKVRRGKVGGYTDYLGDDDLRVIDAALLQLDPRYGYSPRDADTAPAGG